MSSGTEVCADAVLEGTRNHPMHLPKIPADLDGNVNEGKPKGGTKAKQTVQQLVQTRKRHKTNKFSAPEKKLSMVLRGGSSMEKLGGLNKLVGLENLGNTCYLNAVLQCLRGCTLLQDVITHSTANTDKEYLLSRKLRVLFQEMSKQGRTKPWSPKEIFEEICSWEKCNGWKDKKQQDAGELWSCLIEELYEDNKAAGKLFMAEQRNTTKCKTCKRATWQENSCSLLALSMEDNHFANRDSRHEPKTTTTIEELLDKWTSWENYRKEMNITARHAKT